MNTPYRADERAVTPVVGVALLIGITVILAAVLGTVVLGVGIGPADTPNATLSFEVVDDKIKIVHEGGEMLEKGEVVVRDTNGTEYELGADLVTGERTTVLTTGGSPLDLSTTSIEMVTVVWQDSGDSEHVLATFKP